MGEAYLDGRNKSSGIKLNDVIEEYKNVATGNVVEAGDLLVYVDDTVMPALEPPFDAVALTTGTEQVKIARLPVEEVS